MDKSDLETYDFTEEEVATWGGTNTPWVSSYFMDVLNGTTPLAEARENLLSFREESA